MDYEFGDIVDARKYPNIKHFALILGETPQGKDKPAGVLFYIISSRVYKVFKHIISFFNDCIDENYDRFYHFFQKEKWRKPKKEKISLSGRLCDAFFLDKESNYPLHLDEDSFIMLNQNPEIIDKPVIDQLKKDNTITYTNRLCREDTHKLINLIRQSSNISPYMKTEIGRNFNLWNKKQFTG